MEAHPANLPAPTEHRAGIRLPGLGTGIGGGMVMLYLSLIVLLPLAAVASEAFSLGIGHFWEQVTSPLAKKSLELTVICSLIVVVLNGFFGTILAWLLVRDNFPGKSIVNAVIDLPFALPTIVAGLVIMALYGPRTPLDVTIGSFHFDADITFTRTAIYVALLFVTLPFVVRTVQPVLIELDRELEDAARSLGASGFTTFRRIVLPAILPGVLSGVAMAFARAIGEIGAIVLIAGNLPFKTEAASIHLFYRIEQDPEGAAAVAVVLLATSFGVLLGIGAVRWHVTRHERG